MRKIGILLKEEIYPKRDGGGERLLSHKRKFPEEGEKASRL